MLTAAVIAALAMGQAAPVDRNCRDDRGREICSAEHDAQVEALLGLASIAEESEQGAEVYRARYIDGYGRDMPSVSFERRPGADPVVVVYGREGRRLSGPVLSEVWDRVRSEARFADRVLEPFPTSAPSDGRAPPPQICLHAWVVSLEMANSMPERREVTPIRRRIESACGGALAVRYAFLLAEEAVKSIAPCAIIDAQRQRNHVTILETCLGLEGDRFAAASLWNSRSTGMPRYGLDHKDPGVWRAYLGTNGSPRLDWAGQKVETDRGRNNLVAEFIASKVRETPSLRFTPTHFRGLTARRAELNGTATYGDGEARLIAAYRQTWVWDVNLHEWMLENWTVESFRPMD
ncbi:hypothetical protein ACO2Q1_03230 [Brevundimonas sp. VNH65]|uniref:hypothetical protein n=1 Tax=Brevundimonas sp. VNH65 TaxID=3400917 RepID=UPI003C05092C